MAIVVDQPIIDSPFHEPARHYRIRGGTAELVDERRPSGSMPGRASAGAFANLGDAVNHWGKLGRWRYVKIHTPYQLSQVLGVAAPEGDR